MDGGFSQFRQGAGDAGSGHCLYAGGEDGASEEYRGQGEYAWINQNCHRYGWIVRYGAEKEALTGIADEPVIPSCM